MRGGPDGPARQSQTKIYIEGHCKQPKQGPGEDYLQSYHGNGHMHVYVHNPKLLTSPELYVNALDQDIDHTCKSSKISS